MGKDKGWDYLNSDDVNETFNSGDEDGSWGYKMMTEAVPIMEKAEVGGIKTKMEVAHIMRVTTVALTMIRTMTMRGMLQMGSDLQLVWLV